MTTPTLTCVASPASLPMAPKSGRVVLVDIAFAHAGKFETATRPLVDALGDRLALWIDHHDHPAWPKYANDPRFVLVDRRIAPACPELVTEDLCRSIGSFEHVFAHGDFDGCVAAAKLLRGGRAPYAEADEDARAIDSPGKGFRLTERGLRLAMALERSNTTERTKDWAKLFDGIARSLVEEHEPSELSVRIDALVDEQKRRYAELERYLRKAESPHPHVRLFVANRSFEPSDKKFLLRRLEEEATVAVLVEREHVTIATYRDKEIDLRGVEGVVGQPGFVWGRAPLDRVLSDVIDLLDRTLA